MALRQQLRPPRLDWRVLPFGSHYALDLKSKPWTEIDYGFCF